MASSRALASRWMEETYPVGSAVLPGLMAAILDQAPQGLEARSVGPGVPPEPAAGSFLPASVRKPSRESQLRAAAAWLEERARQRRNDRPAEDIEQPVRQQGSGSATLQSRLHGIRARIGTEAEQPDDVWLYRMLQQQQAAEAGRLRGAVDDLPESTVPIAPQGITLRQWLRRALTEDPELARDVANVGGAAGGIWLALRLARLGALAGSAGGPMGTGIGAAVGGVAGPRLYQALVEALGDGSSPAEPQTR